MLKIEKSNIYLTKGDSCELFVKIFQANGEEYALQTGDSLVMTVKQSFNSTTPAIQKTASDEGKFTINPSDTNNISVGIYYYDVQLTTAGGMVNTIIGPDPWNTPMLKIMPEVTS